MTKTEIATRLGVSLKTLSYWMTKPGFPIVHEGRQGEEWALDLAEVQTWVAEKKDREEKAKAGELTPNQRKILAQAKLFEMEIEERAGRLIPVADVEMLLGDLLIELSQVFETMVPRLRSEVGLEPAACRKVGEWLDVFRTELAKKLETITNSYETEDETGEIA